MFKVIEDYSIKCQFCKVFCTAELIEISQEEIERMNQIYEDRVRKRANFDGNIFCQEKPASR